MSLAFAKLSLEHQTKVLSHLVIVFAQLFEQLLLLGLLLFASFLLLLLLLFQVVDDGHVTVFLLCRFRVDQLANLAVLQLV